MNKKIIICVIVIILVIGGIVFISFNDKKEVTNDLNNYEFWKDLYLQKLNSQMWNLLKNLLNQNGQGKIFHLIKDMIIRFYQKQINMKKNILNK